MSRSLSTGPAWDTLKDVSSVFLPSENAKSLFPSALPPFLTDGVFGRCQKFPVMGVYRYEVSPAGLQQLTATLQQLSRTGRRAWAQAASPPGQRPEVSGWCHTTCSAGTWLLRRPWASRAMQNQRKTEPAPRAERAGRGHVAQTSQQFPRGTRWFLRAGVSAGATVAMAVPPAVRAHEVAARRGGRRATPPWRPRSELPWAASESVASARHWYATCCHAVLSQEVPATYLLHGVLR